jgi:HEAT repeat protein
MGFYDLSKAERQKTVFKIEEEIVHAISKVDKKGNNNIFVPKVILQYASDSDTYIRKNTYMAVGRIYWADEGLKDIILRILDIMLENPDEKIRQSSIYALGEIGKQDAHVILESFEKALKDNYRSVINAMVGAMKQMGHKNPEPTFEFARLHLHDKDPEFEGK